MRERLQELISLIKRNPYSFALIVVAAILNLIIILPSGSHYCFKGTCGDFYWGVHEHDGIWHIAVAESAFKSIPPRNPIFSGLALSGYNSLLDQVIFILKLFGIQPLFSYFKLLPVIWFASFTYFLLKISNKWSKKPLFSYIYLFLCFFGASFSFIIPLIKEGTIKGTSSLLSMQAILTLTNLQLAFSYMFLLWILLILLDEKISTKSTVGLIILLYIEWGLKFYTGFISSILVGVFYLVQWMKMRNYKYIIALTLISVSSFISLVANYNPFGQLQGGAPFKLNPLALIWPLIEDPSMFYSPYWANAKYILLSSGKISPRLIFLMFILTSVYIFLNLGPRFIGLVLLVRKNISKKRSVLDVSILVSILISLIFPIFFVQRGVWWNTVQFLFIITFLLNIYTAEFIAGLNNKIVRSFLIIVLVLISIPYAIDSLKGFATYPGVVNISDNEKEALSFLRRQPDGIIYMPLYKPNNLLNRDNNIPLYNHVDSSYVPAYTGKQVFYTNYVQLELLNIPYTERRKKIEWGDCTITAQIKYVYIQNDNGKDPFFVKCISKNKSFKRVFDKASFLIYSKI